MKLIYLPNLKSKSLDTMSHTCFSIINALFRNFDIYMIFNAANSPFTLPVRLMGKKIIINTDGVEWRRSKWVFYGKLYHRASELSACFFANRLISDSKGITAYYKNKHNMYSTEIAYGAYAQRCNKETKLSKLGLKRNEYFLQITRFEPENNPLLTIQAFKRLNTEKKLVVVGGNPYQSEYTKQIERESGGRIILPGFIYDKELLKELWCFCYAYIHGNEAGELILLYFKRWRRGVIRWRGMLFLTGMY
jgi:glycosyltransferase involved in cell wall biosynthesis